VDDGYPWSVPANISSRRYDSEPSPADAMRAIEFLDELLERLPV